MTAGITPFGSLSCPESLPPSCRYHPTLYQFGLSPSIIHPSMRNGILVNPVFLLPCHAFPAWNHSCRPCSIKRAGFGTVTEGLESIFPLLGIPLVDNHLHRHTTAPNTNPALAFVGSGIQPPVTSLPIYLQGWRYPTPWWSRVFL